MGSGAGAILERRPIVRQAMVADMGQTSGGKSSVRHCHAASKQVLYLTRDEPRAGDGGAYALRRHYSEKQCPPLVRRSYERRGGFCQFKG